VGTNYAALSSFSTAETELPTLLTAALSAELLGPVADLVIFAGVNTGAILPPFLDRSWFIPVLLPWRPSLAVSTRPLCSGIAAVGAQLAAIKPAAVALLPGRERVYFPEVKIGA
jgi:hypothetical protein